MHGNITSTEYMEPGKSVSLWLDDFQSCAGIESALHFSFTQQHNARVKHAVGCTSLGPTL